MDEPLWEMVCGKKCELGFLCIFSFSVHVCVCVCMHMCMCVHACGVCVCSREAPEGREQSLPYYYSGVQKNVILREMQTVSSFALLEGNKKVPLE